MLNFETDFLFFSCFSYCEKGDVDQHFYKFKEKTSLLLRLSEALFVASHSPNNKGQKAAIPSAGLNLGFRHSDTLTSGQEELGTEPLTL